MSKIPLVQAGMAARLTLRKRFLDSMKSVPTKTMETSVSQVVVAETVKVAEEVVNPEPEIKAEEPEIKAEEPVVSTESDPKVEEAPTWSATNSKAELIAAAEKLGIEVPANASKAVILKLLAGE